MNQTMKTTSIDIALNKHLKGKKMRSTVGFALWSWMVALLIGGPFLSTLQAQNYLTSTGMPSFAAPYPTEMGLVDSASGNLHLEIPLGSFSQRGGSTANLKLAYDSHIWGIVSDGTGDVWSPTITGGSSEYPGGWRLVAPNEWLTVGSAQWPSCTFDMEFWEPNGTQHWFHVNMGSGTLSSGCSPTTASSYAADSSGVRLDTTYNANDGSPYISWQLHAPDGTLVNSSTGNPNVPEDTNGNYFTGWVDTLGRTVLNTTMEGGPDCDFLVGLIRYYGCLVVSTSQATPSQYNLTFGTITVSTAFGQSGVTEWSGTITVITNIALPDGSSYSFNYDSYGTLTSMTLPTGGEVYYSYSNFTDALGNVGRWVATKSGYSGYWSYTPKVTSSGTGINQEVTVVKPDNSSDVLNFSLGYTSNDEGSELYNGAWLITTWSYDTDGVTLLSTVNNTWDWSQACTLILCNGTNSAQDVRKLSTSTTVPIPSGSITKQTKYTYDTPQTGNVTGVEEWKYQSGSSPTFPAVPDRATYASYATIGTNNNINRPKSITVCNNVGTNSSCTGGGTPVAQTTITYDAYSGGTCPTGITLFTGAVNHDDTNLGCSYTARGNATQISKWVSGSSVLTTTISYDTTGQPIEVVDPKGNPATYSYKDVFYDDYGSEPLTAHSGAPTTNAYVTTVTDAIGTTSMGYYYGSGQMALSTDYNLATTYEHYADPFDRPTKTDYPIGWLLNVYGIPANSQTEIDSYAAVGDTGSTGSASCTLCTHTQALLDGVGRAVTGNLVNNPAGEVTVQSAYDGLNRVNSQSHPYIGTSDPNYVYENGYFDGLGRTIGIQHPDLEIERTAYGAKAANLGGLTSQQSSATTYGYGFPVVSMDEAGKQRQEWIDGFGHVIEVDEPSSNTAARATASVTVSGSEGYTQSCNKITGICHNVYDVGILTLNVNGFAAYATWDEGATAASMAAGLTSALNSFESPVTATLSGTTITMIAGGPGTDPISFSESYPYPGTKDFAFTPTTGTLSGGSGGIISSPYVTTYTYDVLGNLTGVTQGSQGRSYQYDGLSRLTQEITPEEGKMTFSYGTPGALCSGDPSKPCSRTAPAPNQTGTSTVTTTFQYNSANQLTQKTHSDTTGTETYTYGTSPSGFNVGRLITMTDPSGSEAYTYDKIGRVTQVSKTVGSTVYTTSYGYNSGSQLTSITYPSGRVVTYNYDSVGHLCQVATNLSGQCNATSPYLALPSSSYDAAGRPLSATYGNGLVATAAYSPEGVNKTV